MRSTQPTPPPRRVLPSMMKASSCTLPSRLRKLPRPGIKSLVIFHDDDGFLDGVERRPAAFQHPPARSHGVAHTVEMSFHHVIRNGPGTAMN